MTLIKISLAGLAVWSLSLLRPEINLLLVLLVSMVALAIVVMVDLLLNRAWQPARAAGIGKAEVTPISSVTTQSIVPHRSQLETRPLRL
jgi:hypothetical protein